MKLPTLDPSVNKQVNPIKSRLNERTIKKRSVSLQSTSAEVNRKASAVIKTEI